MSDAATELHVVFVVGAAEYALPAKDVAQMESYTGATPIPGAAPHVAGVVQLRGRVIPVVDLRVRFGLEPAELTADSRIVVVLLGTRRVGLLADRAREVARVDPARITPPPPLVAAQSSGLVRAIVQHGPRVLLLLDLPLLVGEEPSNGH